MQGLAKQVPEDSTIQVDAIGIKSLRTPGLVDTALDETEAVALVEAGAFGGNVHSSPCSDGDSLGRLCTSNVATVRIVLDALEKEGVDVCECFCIVINEMSAGVLAVWTDHTRRDPGEGQGGKGNADQNLNNSETIDGRGQRRRGPAAHARGGTAGRDASVVRRAPRH